MNGKGDQNCKKRRTQMSSYVHLNLSACREHIQLTVRSRCLLPQTDWFQSNFTLSFRLVKMSQEIGIVEAAEGSLDVSLFPIGTLLKMIPYHVSMAAGLHLYCTPCTQISQFLLTGSSPLCSDSGKHKG